MATAPVTVNLAQASGAAVRFTLFPLPAVCVAVALGIFGLARCGQGQPSNGERISLATCQDGNENDQRYGTECLCCHKGEFGVAGSVDRSSASIDRIVVVDADGQIAEMSPNQYGNFFRHLQLRGPLRASAFSLDGRVSAMQSNAPSGACNQCHGQTIPRIHGP